MERKIMFEKVLLGLDVREKKILMNLKDDIQLNNIFKDVKKDIDKLPKIKGILKQQKSIKKTTKKLSKAIDSAFDKLLPSHETFIFHCLLEALDKLNYVTNNKTKLIELTSERTGVTIEEVEDFMVKSLKYNPKKFDDKIVKEVVQADIRCSNFLNKVVEINDIIINRKNLFVMMKENKKTVEITDLKEIKNYKEDYEFMVDIVRIIAVGITVLNEIETKYTREEKKQLRYNFSRLKTIAMQLIEKIEVADQLIEESKYKNILLRSFELEGKIPTSGVVESYTQYLDWIKKRKCLDDELDVIKEFEYHATNKKMGVA